MKTKSESKNGFKFKSLVHRKVLRLASSALALGLIFGFVAIMGTSSVAQAASGTPCTVPGTTYGTDTETVSAPATGSINIWTRMQAPATTSNEIMLQVTDVTTNTVTCFATVGGPNSNQLPSLNTWSWVDQNNSTSLLTSVTLNANDQVQLEYIGIETGVSVDTSLLLSDTSCTPTGATGGTCTTGTTGTGVTLPFNMAAGVSQGFTDSSGTVWQPDQYFTQDNSYGSGGGVSPGGDGSACSTTIANSNCTLHTITGPSAQLAYQDERWGDFHYDIPIAAGSYSVILKFAEINPPASGSRMFNATVEGNQVLTNFNIAADAGASYKEDDQTFQVTVPSSGTYANDLNIGFVTVSDTAKLSAIQILSNAPPTINLTAPTANSTVSGASVPLSATVANTSGATTVTYAIDGTTVGTDSTSPYSINWNSTTVADGSHTFSATVNSNGQTSTPATETINVANNTCSAAPSAPTGLLTSGVTASNVTVNWTAATPAANCTISGYNVYRSTTQNGTYSKINPNIVSGASYSDSTVTSNTTYYYKVTTVYSSTTNPSGAESVQSTASAPVTTSQNCSSGSGQPTTPGVPTIVAGGTSYTQVALTWTVSTDSDGCTLSGYHIYRNGNLINTVNSNNYTDTGSDLPAGSLTSSTNYNYYVQAYDSGGNTSGNSTTASLSTKADDQAPTMPTGLIASNVGSNSVTLSWNASTDLPNPGASGIGGYYIYENDSANATFTTTGIGTTFNVTNLTPGTTYKFAIVAYDKASTPNKSAETTDISATTTTAACSSSPSVPTNLTSPSQTQTSINLSWGASTAPAGCTLEGYQIYRNHVALPIIVTTTTYTDSGLITGQYTYSVAAIDTNGPPSANTADQTFSTQADTTPPSAPTNFKAVAPVATQVELSWTPSTDNVGVQDYVITRTGGAAFTPVTLNGENVSSYLDSTVSASTAYTYTIKAFDFANNPSTATTVQITTPASGTTQKPPTPTALQSLLITANFVDITWNASAGASSYTIYRDGTQVATGITTTEYGDSNLNDNTTYTYTVAASNSAGSSAQSGGLQVQTLISPTTTLIGDITGPLGKPDGKVNVFDLAILLANYNQANQTYSQGDLDNNGVVNVTDLGIMLSNWTG